MGKRKVLELVLLYLVSVATLSACVTSATEAKTGTLELTVPYASHDVNEDGKIECSPGGMSYAGSECFVGAVSVFGRNEGSANNFGLLKSFVAADGAGNDGLGYAVALSDKGIGVGAPGHAKRIGAVYVLGF